MSETDSTHWGGLAQTDSTHWGLAQTELNDGKNGRMAQIETEGQTDRHGYAQSKATSFAFAEQSSLYHKCTTAMDRNKNTRDDYNVWYNDGVDINDPYTDPNFPTNDALWWLDAGE
jgi:hypothetical protein